jgi:solute carrier family 25 carnitine/acylcarnitine transporter 20/29
VQYEATVRFFGRRPVATHDSTSLVDTVQAEAATVRWPVFLFAGGLAGVTSWLATFPFDVLKTRVQASAGPTSMWTTARAAYMQGGVRVFFAGLAPTLIRYVGGNKEVSCLMTGSRAIPVNMVNFGVFEATLYALSSS